MNERAKCIHCKLKVAFRPIHHPRFCSLKCAADWAYKETEFKRWCEVHKIWNCIDCMPPLISFQCRR